jgi:hypothetical protein
MTTRAVGRPRTLTLPERREIKKIAPRRRGDWQTPDRRRTDWRVMTRYIECALVPLCVRCGRGGNHHQLPDCALLAAKEPEGAAKVFVKDGASSGLQLPHKFPIAFLAARIQET